MWSIFCHLKLLEATAEFVCSGWGGRMGWWGGVVFKVIFISNPTAVEVELEF